MQLFSIVEFVSIYKHFPLKRKPYSMRMYAYTGKKKKKK